MHILHLHFGRLHLKRIVYHFNSFVIGALLLIASWCMWLHSVHVAFCQCVIMDAFDSLDAFLYIVLHSWVSAFCCIRSWHCILLHSFAWQDVCILPQMHFMSFDTHHRRAFMCSPFSCIWCHSGKHYILLHSNTALRAKSLNTHSSVRSSSSLQS